MASRGTASTPAQVVFCIRWTWSIVSDIREYQYRDLATPIIATIILVILVDLISQVSRSRVLDPHGRRAFIRDSGEGQP